MKINLLYLGNDGNLLKNILRLRNINLIGVVADRVSEAENKYFGSAFKIANKLGIRKVSQDNFHKNERFYLNSVFKGIDIAFVIGYHYRINAAIPEYKNIKLINFHQSLLPKYAGRHPLNWVIVNGETNTGISFHFINMDFDAGDIILQKKIRITKGDTAISLYNKTVERASRYLGKVFDLVYDNSFVPHKQDLRVREYFRPRTPADGEILRGDSIQQVKNKIRALVYPYKGAFLRINGNKIVLGGVNKIKDSKKYKRIDFAGVYNKDIILKVSDGVLKVRTN